LKWEFHTLCAPIKFVSFVSSQKSKRSASVLAMSTAEAKHARAPQHDCHSGVIFVLSRSLKKWDNLHFSRRHFESQRVTGEVY
jgi:hypothetical protein